MGVPKFVRALLRRSPDIALPEAPPAVDHLYLDFNASLHPVARRVMTDEAGLDAGEMENAILEAMVVELDRVVHEVRPTQSLFVALDGPAPVAKMAQQRERRFRSAKEYEALGELCRQMGFRDRSPVWDTNAITPGSSFLLRVGARLREVLQTRRPHYPPTRILSDGNVPGEGEHKIFARIRKEPTGTHVILGLDADLLFLAMVSPARDILLLREDDDRKQWLSIERFRECMLSEVDVPRDHPHVDRVLEDLCFLASLFGNDFLPTIYAFDLRQNGLGRALEAYREQWKRTGQPLHEGPSLHRRLDFQRLADLLEPCDVSLEQEAAAFVRRRPPVYQPKHAMDAETAWIEAWKHNQNWPPIDRVIDRIAFGETGWQDRYYVEQLHLSDARGVSAGGEDLASMRRALAIRYLEGMFWVRDYYVGQMRDAQWSYGYHASPLVEDLVHALRSLQGWRPTFEKRPFVHPLEQLALVLPASSFGLLPPTVAALAQDPAAPWWPYYPSSCTSQGLFRSQAWEWSLLLPTWPEDLTPWLEDLRLRIEQLPVSVRRRNAFHRETIFCDP